jgi:hypothetical protein
VKSLSQKIIPVAVPRTTVGTATEPTVDLVRVRIVLSLVD